MSWWTGDDVTTDIVDGNDGVLMNGASYAAGKVNNAFSLDRALSQYVSIGNPANLRLSGSLTLDAWVYPASVPPADDIDRSQMYSIVVKWGQNRLTDAYGLWLHSYDGMTIEVLGAIGNPWFSDGGLSGGGFALIPNAWSFVAMTYDAITGENYIYVNGDQVADRIWSGGTNASDLNVLIGKEDSIYPRYFDGRIDEPEIFDRALTPQEIIGIFQSGALGKCRT